VRHLVKLRSRQASPGARLAELEAIVSTRLPTQARSSPALLGRHFEAELRAKPLRFRLRALKKIAVYVLAQIEWSELRRA
jgi:hypothetical protein